VKGKRAESAHRTGAPAVVDRADGLRRILDDRDAMPLANARAVRPCRTEIAVQVNREDGLGARRDGLFDQRRVGHQESGRMSTNTGFAPRCTMGAALAIQLVSAR
jgi:hypothetical protein